jgi:hypothetical protein
MKRSTGGGVRGMVYYVFTDEAHRDIRGSVRAYRNAVEMIDLIEEDFPGKKTGDEYEYLKETIRLGYEMGRDKRMWKNKITQLINYKEKVK